MLVELNFDKKTFSNAKAWLWHHPELNSFCDGIDADQLYIRFSDVRLFKAIVVQQNIPVCSSFFENYRPVFIAEIDDFIAKYHPEEDINTINTEAA